MNTLKNQDDSTDVPRQRDRAKTARELRSALKKLVEAREPISISAVAKVAGVTPALIHNKYSDVAEAIRKQVGKTTRAERDEKRNQLAALRDVNKVLREENNSLLADVKKLASINESLRRQLLECKAVVSAKNVVPLRPK